MKAILLITLLLAGQPQKESKTPQEAYIEKYSPAAVREMRRSGVPASITLAQGLVESDAGKSRLAVQANNHFGIKCHESWKGARIYHDDDEKGECFRSYPRVQDSYADHSDFLRYRDRYKSLFDLDKTDYKGWARGLKKAGYATDPKYADKLIDVIEKYQLYRFDKVKQVPPSPLKLESSIPCGKTAGIEVSETIRYSIFNSVMKKNGVPCVLASEGDTYSGIALANGLYTDEILRYNDAESDTKLPKGTVVYLSWKRARAEKGLSAFVVEQETQSLWEISQRFGVKMSSLRKKNPQLEGTLLKREDTVKLR